MESSRSGVRFGLGRQSSLKPPEGQDEGPEIEADVSFKNIVTVGETDDAVDGEPEIPSVIRLMYMAKDGNVDGIMDLLNCGTDVNFRDIDGRTALHIAACQNFADVVELLLKNGSKIDPIDRWGSTPLADAIHYKNNEVIKVLDKYGAKIQLVPRFGSFEVPEYEIDSQELDFSDSIQITKGTFRSASWRGIKVAVKTLGDDFLDDEDKVRAFRDELALLQKIRHPNVVQFLGAVTQSSPMMIVTEYLPKGDLRDHLKKNGALKSAIAVKFALDIARGMSYLHENKPEAIIHRDLEPSNILQDDSGHLKVADFGISKFLKLAKIVKEDEPLAGQDTSCRYVAPEVFLNKGYDTKVDVFSFSLILQEMFEGHPPFSSRTENDAKKERPPFRASPKLYPRGIKQLIEECWSENPGDRPTFRDIIRRLQTIQNNLSQKRHWKVGSLKCFPSLEAIWKRERSESSSSLSSHPSV
ncbi:Protein kinase family protein [Zostera marina]|uniref:Protein kinase family protein n=1 Tax=Zostera marina TaxID=29655 RepID=A0A0K9P8P8_ZOSMR|nr:Protein kinase family protein [Zostera marina]